MNNKLIKKLKSETDRLVSIYNAGDFAALEKAARRYVSSYPEQGVGLKVLAIALQKQKKYRAALAAYNSALERNSRDPELYNNLGVVHKELGNFADAESAVRTALRLQPMDAVAHNNLGNILRGQNKLVEAIEEYQQALRLDPLLAMAYNNLGNTYKGLDRNTEAADLYTKALSINPDFVEARQNLGSILLDMGRLEEALECFSDLMKCKAGDIETQNKLGSVLQGLGRYEEAENTYMAAVRENPEHAGLHTNLGNVLGSQGRIHDAMTFYRTALSAHPSLPDPVVHLAMASLPAVVSACSESDQAPDNFSRSLDQLEEYACSHGWDLLGSAITVRLPFNLSYRLGNHRGLLSRYGDIAARARREWLNAQDGNNSTDVPPSGGRIRLGIVSAHVRRHSVWYVLLRGLLTHLDRSLFEVIVYHTDPVCDSETDYANSLVDRFEQGPQNWLRRIREDSPDILFYPDLAMDPETLKTGLLRLAPLQVTTWGHPITSGLPEIDIYMSGELLEGPVAPDHYREQLVLLPGTGACSCLMAFDMKPLSEGLLALPEDRDVTRFFVSQRAMKFDPVFDGLYAEIACKAEPCHFWFVRDLKIPWASELVEQRIAAAFRDKGLEPERYVTWVDWIPGDQFRACMEEMDVFLDTPAFSGFTTAWQAVHSGLPVVTIEGEFLRQRLAAGLLRRIGITDTIAHSVVEYVTIAISLANDREKRQELRRRLKSAARGADEDVSVVRALENAMITGLKQKNGLRPPLEHTIAISGRFT